MKRTLIGFFVIYLIVQATWWFAHQTTRANCRTFGEARMVGGGVITCKPKESP